MGPSIIDLAHFTHSSISDISWFLPSWASGYLAGSILCGLFFDKLEKKNRFVAFTMFVMGVTQALVPWQTSVPLLCFVIFVSTLATGAMDVAGGSQMFAIWGSKGGRYMQTLEASIVIGCFLGPILVKPFLIPEISSEKMYLDANVTSKFDNLTSVINSNNVTATQRDTSANLDIRVSFGVIGAICVFVGLLFLLRRDMAKANISDSSKEASPKATRLLVILAALFAAAVISGHVGTLLTTFVVVSDFRLTKAYGATMTTVYWLANLAAQVFCIVFPNFLPPAKKIMLFLGFIAIGNGLLYYSTVWLTVPGLWISTMLLALSWPMYTFIFTFLNQFMPITASVSSVLLAAFCFGKYCFQWIY